MKHINVKNAIGCCFIVSLLIELMDNAATIVANYMARKVKPCIKTHLTSKYLRVEFNLGKV